MNQRRYQGRLYYDDSAAGHIDVQSFILRESEIGYSLESVGQVHGRWTAESGKAALLQDDGTFLAREVCASKLGVKASSAWKITFKIEEEVIGETVEVSGSIEEAGEVSTFSGELLASG